jgi:20S proteasome subunit alpha 3
MTVDDALKLAVKVMNKTMDTTTMTPERVEFCTLMRENDQVVIRTLDLEETTKLVAEVIHTMLSNVYRRFLPRDSSSPL